MSNICVELGELIACMQQKEEKKIKGELKI